MRKFVIIYLLWGITEGFAQNINKIEYFIDADPGYGAGTDVPITPQTPITADFNVPIASITNGFHFLNIRARDVNNAWSIVGTRPFYKETLTSSAVPNITAMEYFIDADPGYGAGTVVSFTANNTVNTSFTVALPNTVSDGFHFLSIRAKDANNQWSVVGVRPFYKEAAVALLIPNIVAMEYFIDADPGYGAATAVSFTADNTVNTSFTVALPNTVSDGFHFLSIRAKDANNKWSIVGVRPFYKETLTSSTIPNITAMEYFIDADPGYGAATAVSFTPNTPVVLNFTANLASLSLGTHTISIRAKDATNKWSVVGVKSFEVSNTFAIVSSYPASYCRNMAFNIPFNAVGTYNTGNVFTAQLSNASGSFSSPTTLGTLTATASGTISATIPNSVSLGSGYQIRIVSSSPALTSNPSVPITITTTCPPPCSTNLTLVSPADDYSNGILLKEANATTGVIVATNKITNTANVTYRVGKSITLNAGFKADNGVVFKTEFGGCN